LASCGTFSYGGVIREADTKMTEFEPGQFVRNPSRPDWGLGQVQSVVEARVTVNFENIGKILVNTVNVVLEIER
jgi:hypothetical protein